MITAAGRRRHKVVIQKDTGTTTDAYGEKTPSWVTHATVFASVEPVTAREILTQKVTGNTTHTVKTVHVAGVTADMRIKFGDRYLYLSAPPIDVRERGRELEMLCEERDE